jgi:WD40 repeat protein
VVALPPPRGDEVRRPRLTDALIEAVLRPDAGTVGVTTAVVGAGGFGKSTLARMVAHDPRIVHAFPDGRLWVSLGADAVGADLAAAIVSVGRLVDPGIPQLSDPLAAGARLGQVLDGRRVLLVVDDVWTSGQVEPFLLGGDRSVRLFTTRQRDILPVQAVHVPVDQMTNDEAAQLLTGELTISTDLVAETGAVCGSWPVLLALVHGAVAEAVRAGATAEHEMREVLAALRRDGITVLDVGNPDQRSRAAARTIGISLDRLDLDERQRYLELAVFGEDVRVPGGTVARLWAHTGGWTAFRSRRFCQRLFDLSLLAAYQRNPDSVLLHDVMRSYLRAVTVDRRAELHRELVTAHRMLAADWADLEPDETYLWTWLPTHLQAAGSTEELDDVLSDPRWLLGKLAVVGAAGLESDLLLSTRPTPQALAVVVRQNAHLLAPLDAPGALAATLVGQLPANDPVMRTFRDRLIATGARLVGVGDPPDTAHPALNRVLTGHNKPVDIAAAPRSGAWLAAVDGSTIRIWDLATGALRHICRGHRGEVRAIDADPAGRWLASSGDDDTVRIWDCAAGSLQHTLVGHTNAVHAVLAAPDGSWLASTGNDRTVRIWDLATGALRHKLDGHTAWVRALAAAPDGSWLASAGYDRTIRIWNPMDGSLRHVLEGHTDIVRVLAAPDTGDWLASRGDDLTLRIWNPTTGNLCRTHQLSACPTGPIATPTGGAWLATCDHDTVVVVDPHSGRRQLTLSLGAESTGALAVAPGGSWLAAGDGRTVHVWNPDTGDLRGELTGHLNTITFLLAGGGDQWLASTSSERTIRIWHLPAAAGTERHPRTQQVPTIARATNGRWLATADEDLSINIWDPGRGTVLRTIERPGGAEWPQLLWSAFRRRRTFSDVDFPVWHREIIAAAPGQRWIAACGDHAEVLIWDAETAALRHTLGGHTGVWTLISAPDGSWLATADRDGTVRIWETDTGTLRHLWDANVDEADLLTAAGPSWLARLGDKGAVQVWDVATGSTVHVLADPDPDAGRIVASACSDSWLATAAENGFIRVWDLHAGVPRHRLFSGDGNADLLLTTPDGAWLASAGHDHTIRLWDPMAGTLQGTLSGHTGAVRALALSPDGRYLTSASEDGTARMWDLADGGAVTAAIRLGQPLVDVVHITDTQLVVSGKIGHYFLTVRGPVD